MQLHFLTIEGKRIAVQMTLLMRQKLYILKSGYDPHYAAFAPSLLLCEMMLRQSWRNGLVEVDFLDDAERWKMEWASETRTHSWLFVFPDRGRTRMLHHFKFSVLPKIHNNALYRVVRRVGKRMGFHVHE